MKRDWDLIRKILLKLEEKADTKSLLQDTEIKGFDPETVSYHFKLLHSAGLIEGVDFSSMTELSYVALSLTWAGHEFLDKIRSDTIWNNIKTLVKTKSLDLSLDVIKKAASVVIGSMLP